MNTRTGARCSAARRVRVGATRLDRQGGTSFTYVTDGIENAIGQARAAANGKNVAIAGGGTLLRQAIKLGVVDELELHVVPVILGAGMSLLGPEIGLADKEGIELTPSRIIAAPDVTHIRYELNGKRDLVRDNRGRDHQPVPNEERAA
jgi:dihydrofolate reductase